MPGDTSTFPQLPPIPPQTPFVTDGYPWERHYPQTSWAPLTSIDPGRGKPTSPGMRVRPLPVPPLATTPPSSSVGVVSSLPRSQFRTHSRSRSGPRVPILPSASSAEPIVISPPPRMHSRSASAVLPKPPPPPTAADSTAKAHPRSKSRPLPLPIPIPSKDSIPSADHDLVRSESLPLPLERTLASAPPAPQSVRRHASPPHPREQEAVQIPMSAPGRKPDSSLSHSRAIFVSVSSDKSFLSLDAPASDPVSAPVRIPTPPRSKQKVGLPATPRRQDDNGNVERGRSAQSASIGARASPSQVPDPTSGPHSNRTGDGYTRKWVLEKKGKRLTQDTIVVAQQLRLLR
ncbi:hypothetical protein BD414DRAFT_497198 [Trametes punicea]|nr:hypothetical protein BD414DRAFT_497198 [Trametes punicea]